MRSPSIMHHAHRNKAIVAAWRYIRRDPNGGELTICRELDGLKHTGGASCPCMPLTIDVSDVSATELLRRVRAHEALQ